MNIKVVGKFLKKRRLSLNISQKLMAQKLGFKTCQLISNIERGVSGIPSSRIKDFAKILELDTKDLLKLIADSKNDKVYKKNMLDLNENEDDLFIKNFSFAWSTLNLREKEALKLVLTKFLNIKG